MHGRRFIIWTVAAIAIIALGCSKQATEPATGPTPTETAQVDTSPPAETPAESGSPASVAATTAALVPTMGSVAWEDPAGDVPVLSGRAQPDLIGVKAVGHDGYLFVSFKLAGGPEAVLDQVSDGKRAGDTLAEIWIDADNDPATGRGPSDVDGATRPLVGYETDISVMLGYRIRVKENGMESAMHGNVGIDEADMEVLGYSATLMFSWLGTTPPETGFDSFHAEDYCKMTKTGVVVRLPYDVLGVKAGDTIRLCFNEDNQDTFGAAGFSPDRALVLE